jgi:hypothetical protein
VAVDQNARENILRLRNLETYLPINLWLAMVTDAVAALIPANSSLLKELGNLSARIEEMPVSTVEGAAPNDPNTEIRRQVNAILLYVDSLVDLYKPPPTLDRAKLLEDMKQDLNRELERAKQDFNHGIDNSISDRVFKHWTFRILSGLLVALIAAFLGIDILFSQKVAAAQQHVVEMQAKLDSAKLAIFEKASELNKTLDAAREDILRSRDAANDVLLNDRNKDEKDIEWVKGNADDQLKKEGIRGSDLVKAEEGAQIELLRKAAAQKVAHINEPWAIWLLGTSWVLPALALLCSVIALVVSLVRK